MTPLLLRYPTHHAGGAGGLHWAHTVLHAIIYSSVSHFVGLLFRANPAVMGLAALVLIVAAVAVVLRHRRT